MAGQWEKQSEGWRFSPQFPLLPGVTYQALCYEREGWNSDPGIPILASVPFQMARSRSSSRAQVEAIYPSASKLPANLLKFYIHFSAPMSRGHIYQHIHLVETTGQPTEMPFLEVDEELWDPTLTRLTLFFDPGRIKRGVEPLESIGPSLIEGHRYRLTIDRDWLDASGTPLRRSFSKTFLVGPPDRSPLDIDQWKTLPPEEGSRHPLRIQFPKPIDHALGLRLFRVIEVGSGTIQGVATLSHEESSWSWIPEQPWRSGRYEVVVPDILEDVCGNNLHKPFDVDLLEPLNPLLSDSVSRISFTVESSARSKHP